MITKWKNFFQFQEKKDLREVNEMKEYFKIFGDKLPKELNGELNKLEERYSKY